MLQTLGLFMHLLNRIIEHFIQKCLDEPVMTHYFECSFLSREGKKYATMPLIFDEWRRACGELLQHVCNGGWRNVQPASERIACHLVLFRPAQSQYCLEVVVHGFAVR